MKKQLILLILIIQSGVLLAQQAITGKVTGEDSEPLPGVSVLIQYTQKGTATDIDGNYSITAGPNDTLVFSMVGYTTVKRGTAGQSIIDVNLTPDIQKLEEVVVIGYGTVRKSDLTGSVSSLKGSEITKITSLNAEQGLQGKVTGVQVTSASGAPGANPTVRIRGVGTFNNSSPIYVVDGVILNDISFLSSGDIASMEVLKDASATAIYGSRGANGVIIVTTKTGKIGDERISISYSGEYGIQSLEKKIDLLTGREFATIYNEVRPGTYNNVDAVPNTDWQDLIFREAPMQNHQLSLSGAGKQSQYYLSLGYFNQEGILSKSNYERLSIKLNNTYAFSKVFTIGNNFTIAPYKQRFAPGVVYQAYRAWPTLEPYYSDGSFGSVIGVGNPLAEFANSNNYRKGIRGVGNIFAEATVNWLRFRSSFGIDASYNKGTNFTPAFTVYNPDGSASMQNNLTSDLVKISSDDLTWLWENTLTLDKQINKHHINGVLGYTLQNTTSEIITLPGENIIRNGSDFWYLQGSYLQNIYQNNNVDIVDPNLYYSMMSFLFRVNYSYDNRYILTSTFRRDYSSKFSKSNRYGDFPSFAVGWNIFNEGFMSNVPLVSNLKIRGSWGKIGNEKIDYSDRFSLTQNAVAVFGRGDFSYPGVTYAKSGNPDLRWETTTQTDIGLEIGFFNNKLTGEFDYYHRETDDILVQLTTPGHTGNGQGEKVRYNAGSVLNTGFEFQVNWKHNFGDLNYNITALGSTVHNEVLSVGGNSGVDSLLYGGGIKGFVTQTRKGLPIGAFYGYKTDGIFQTTEDLASYPHNSQAGVGDLRFVDVNQDNLLNENDRTYIGSPIPTFIYGINVGAEYKRIELSVDLQGQTGNKIFNGKEIVRPDPYNFEKHVMDRWTGPNTSNSEPRPSFDGYNYIPSDKYIQDGSFLRIRNITLAYVLPERWTQKASLNLVRIYVKGSNIKTFSKYTGYTPEIGSSNVLGVSGSTLNSLLRTDVSDVLSNGIDMGVYPVSTVWSVGVNLTF